MTATPAGMTYADYLKLDTLLSAQQPLSDLHDEMLFVIIHQTKELWLKQMLHEVGFACRLVREDKFAEAYKALSRVSRIWSNSSNVASSSTALISPSNNTGRIARLRGGASPSPDEMRM